MESNINIPEFKDCPLCGHKASLTTIKNEKGYEAQIECNNCFLILPSIICDNEQTAINNVANKWNKNRPNDPIHAHWIEIPCDDNAYNHKFTCSNCHGTTPDSAFPVSPDFCPYCGAIMDETISHKDEQIKAIITRIFR